MRGSNLFAACSLVVAGLPREDKEKLLRSLATECGYTLEPAGKTIVQNRIEVCLPPHNAAHTVGNKA